MRGKKQNGNVHPTRIFKHPDELLKAYEEYCTDLQENQKKDWPISHYVGRNGDLQIEYPVLPRTFEGFQIFCRKHYGSVEQYFLNSDKYYDDFIGICREIKQDIRNHQITGGLLHKFNPSITQRLNNLTDKQEVTVKEQPLFGDDKE